MVWAALAPIDGAAVAHGVIAVESARKSVQHLEGGIVSEILVREGDRVQAGDVLLRLDKTRASSELEAIRSQYLALRAREARLRAERDRKETLEFPADLVAMHDDHRLDEAIAGERRLFESRRRALAGEKDLLRHRGEQLDEQIRGLQALSDSKAARIKLYQEEIDGLKSLFAKGLGDKNRLREAQRQVVELEGERADHRAAIAAARVQINETQLQIAQRDREFERDVIAELREVETRLLDLGERIRALQNTLDRTEIRAPVSGFVVGMAMHTIGGVIRAGDHILDIVPEKEEFIVEARVAPNDVDRVYPGLEADLRMSAFNTRTTPIITGTVLTVSADLLTVRDQSFYLARIRVTPEGMSQLKGLTLQAGMPVEVMVKTGERTFVDYLLRPITDMFARAFREE